MPSFDVVSQVKRHEVTNAVAQAAKEIGQRFDFKNTETEIEETEEGIVLRSGTEHRLEAARRVLEEKLVKRGVSLRALDADDPVPGAKHSFRQVIKLKEGIESEKAREVVRFVKDQSKLQASIQQDTVRVSGKKRDELQSAIAAIRAHDFGIEIQFINFRD